MNTVGGTGTSGNRSAAMAKVANEPAICVSAPRCYMKRMKPLLRSGFVGRPRATSEKRSPIHIENKAMSKSTQNTGKPWSSTEVKQVQKLANENTPTRVIGIKLGRTAGAVQSKASEKGISLKPTNQSPHNRQKK